MNLENVHYNAFISYRHCELDMFVAENLHRSLEAFKLPAGIRKECPDLPKKIERVFRDQEELPLATNLADPITEALQNSDNLIVICTPRLKESLWCQKEIETFISMHGREHVFAVLAEGEPEDSFPIQLLTDDKGQPVEPLGADFRGDSHREILKKMKTESLRLIAPMFSLDFDDLRQRHREQRTKRIITIGAIAMAIVLAFGIYSFATAMVIKKQADDIAAQNVQITKQSEEIEKQNVEIKAQAHDIALKYAITAAAESETLMKKCDKPAAIKLLRDALPDDKSDEILPYTPECERALADCLGMYNVGVKFLPSDYYQSDKNLVYVGMSEDGQYLAYLEEGGSLKVYDLATHTQLYEKPAYSYAGSLDAVICAHKVIYTDENSSTIMLDIDSGEEKKLIDYGGIIKKVRGHEYITASDYNYIGLIDASTGEQILDLPLEKVDDSLEYMNCSGMSDDEKYFYAGLATFVEGVNRAGRFVIMDVSTGEVVDEILMDDGCCVDSICQDGNRIFLAVSKHFDLFDAESYIWAYDTANKQILYKRKVNNHELADLYAIEKDGAKYLFARDDIGPNTFDYETGELLYSESAFESIEMVTILESGYVMLTLQNGQIVFYDASSGYLFVVDYFAYPYFDSVKDVAFVKGMFVFHGDRSNRIGVYRTSMNPETVSYEEEPEYTAFDLDVKEIEIAAHDMKLVYVSGGAELHDKSGNCIADIAKCIGYDEANDKLIFSKGGYYYTLPIFSYEDILAAADSYLAE